MPGRRIQGTTQMHTGWWSRLLLNQQASEQAEFCQCHISVSISGSILWVLCRKDYNLSPVQKLCFLWVPKVLNSLANIWSSTASPKWLTMIVIVSPQTAQDMGSISWGRDWRCLKMDLTVPTLCSNTRVLKTPHIPLCELKGNCAKVLDCEMEWLHTPTPILLQEGNL